MHRDRQLRARWLALCADPTRDDLADAIALAFRRELDDALAALSAATADDRRADAIGHTLRAALGLQLTRERALLRPGPYLLDLQGRLTGAADAATDDATDDPDPIAPDPDPFLPWTLGDRAGNTSGLDRARLLDAAIAAFDAIALQPIDPGNDLGPFTRIAALMDESQARRALAVVARMTGAGWGALELDHARAYLFARLAELGRIDEAESLLPAITDGSTRAYARGRVFGHRIAHGREWALPAAEPPGEPLHAFMCGLTDALPDPPEPLVLACLDLVHAPMEVLLTWRTVGPLAAWSAALREHGSDDVRIGARLDLAAARLDDPGTPELVRAALHELLATHDPGPWIDDLLAVRAHVTQADAVAVFTAWMARAAHSPRAWLIRDLYYTRSFTDLLRWLAGDPALAAAARELAELTALLADVPSDS